MAPGRTLCLRRLVDRIRSHVHRRTRLGRLHRPGSATPLIIAFLTLSSVVCPLSSLLAATITGNLQTTTSHAAHTNLIFIPLSTPLTSSTTLFTSTPTNVIADVNGDFSVSLKLGNYAVAIGSHPRDRVFISVPDGAGTYYLVDLLTNNLTYTFPAEAPLFERIANKAAASGYASLDGATNVPATQLTYAQPADSRLTNLLDHGVLQNMTFVTMYPGGLITIGGIGGSAPEANEIHLLSSSGHLRFDQDAFATDTLETRFWKFNSTANADSNNVATLGDLTNILTSPIIRPFGSSAVGLKVIGAIGQDADLFQIRDYALNRLLNVQYDGGIYGNGAGLTNLPTVNNPFAIAAQLTNVALLSTNLVIRIDLDASAQFLCRTALAHNVTLLITNARAGHSADVCIKGPAGSNYVTWVWEPWVRAHWPADPYTDLPVTNNFIRTNCDLVFSIKVFDTNETQIGAGTFK